MNGFKEKICESLADLGDLVATLSSGSTSFFNCCQPKEPEAVRVHFEEKKSSSVLFACKKKSYMHLL